jgi:hypothetical protein
VAILCSSAVDWSFPPILAEVIEHPLMLRCRDCDPAILKRPVATAEDGRRYLEEKWPEFRPQVRSSVPCTELMAQPSAVRLLVDPSPHQARCDHWSCKSLQRRGGGRSRCRSGSRCGDEVYGQYRDYVALTKPFDILVGHRSLRGEI